MAINTPKPISRDERYLSKIGGNEEVIVPKPISREEKYMYRAAGYDDQPIPDYPISRKEKYWAKIIENGGGSGIGSTVTFDSGQKFISDNSSLKDYKIYGNGGEIHPTGVLPLTFTAKGGTAVDWVIEGNDDVGENLWGKGCPVYNYSSDYKKYNAANAIELLAGTYRITSDVKLPTLQAFDSNHNQIVPIGNAIELVDQSYYIGWNNYALLGASASTTSAVIVLKVNATITLVSPVSNGHWIMITAGSTDPTTISRISRAWERGRRICLMETLNKVYIAQPLATPLIVLVIFVRISR